jgi:hypothetical protein
MDFAENAPAVTDNVASISEVLYIITRNQCLVCRHMRLLPTLAEDVESKRLLSLVGFRRLWPRLFRFWFFISI